MEPQVEANFVPFADLDPRAPWPGQKVSGKGRTRRRAQSDVIAFRKRVAKRRAKKGYK